MSMIVFILKLDFQILPDQRLRCHRFFQGFNRGRDGWKIEARDFDTAKSREKYDEKIFSKEIIFIIDIMMFLLRILNLLYFIIN